MLRPRLRPLKPRQKRSLLHWGLEIVVVVVGVLLALAAAEWAEDRRQSAAAERAAAAMAIELQTISVAMWHGVARFRCQNQQIDRLYRALRSPEEPWRPDELVVDAVRQERFQEDSTSLPNFFPVDPFIVHNAAREHAEAIGALQWLEPERARRFAFLYAIADIAYEANHKSYELSRRLLGLSLEQPPSAPERRELLRILGEVNEQHLLFGRYARGFLGTWETLGEKSDQVPPELMEGFGEGRAEVLRRLQEDFGTCARIPESPYWDGVIDG